MDNLFLSRFPNQFEHSQRLKPLCKGDRGATVTTDGRVLDINNVQNRYSGTSSIFFHCLRKSSIWTPCKGRSGQVRLAFLIICSYGTLRIRAVPRPDSGVSGKQTQRSASPNCETDQGGVPPSPLLPASSPFP